MSPATGRLKGDLRLSAGAQNRRARPALKCRETLRATVAGSRKADLRRPPFPAGAVLCDKAMVVKRIPSSKVVCPHCNIPMEEQADPAAVIQLSTRTKMVESVRKLNTKYQSRPIAPATGQPRGDRPSGERRRSGAPGNPAERTYISGTIDGDGRPQPALDVPAQISASVELDARAEIFG